MEQFVYSNEGRVLLREATADDAVKIYDMYQDSTPKSWWKDKETSKFRYDLVEEANGKVFVAMLDEEVIGHIELILPPDKSDSVYLIRLEIHDEYRRRKFGIELVRFSAIMMKNLGYESYVTWPNPDKSKGLYKKVGLKEIKENPELTIDIFVASLQMASPPSQPSGRAVAPLSAPPTAHTLRSCNEASLPACQCVRQTGSVAQFSRAAVRSPRCCRRELGPFFTLEAKPFVSAVGHASRANGSLASVVSTV